MPFGLQVIGGYGRDAMQLALDRYYENPGILSGALAARI
jgi:hypothetical protein